MPTNPFEPPKDEPSLPPKTTKVRRKKKPAVKPATLGKKNKLHPDVQADIDERIFNPKRTIYDGPPKKKKPKG